MGKLLLVDGPHALYRSCWAHAELTYERAGEEHKIGGVYGFINMIRRAHEKVGSDVVVIAWEDPQRHMRGFRRMLFPEYKQRVQADQEVDYGIVELRQFVREQQKVLSPALSLIGVLQAYAPEWEADDVLATVCRDLGAQHEVVIFSGDKDIFSLINDRVNVMRPLQDGYQMITPEVWNEEHKVKPGQWAQVLALAGDDSDNIPGVKGIGFKTAEKLLREHRDLEGILSAAQAGQIKRFSEAITAIADQIRLNLKLTTLNSQVDLIWTQPQRNEQAVVRKFREWKFHSMTSFSEMQSVLGMGTDGW
jgi:DNA polymerase-1